MTVSLASPLWPGASTFPGTDVYPGQGLQPIVRARVSYDDYLAVDLTWTEVEWASLRSFEVQRGRSSERAEVDAGTATIVVDDRDRAYDPTFHSYVHPMNRWWLYAEWNGRIVDLFRGYADSYELSYPGGGWSDAITTVHCADEIKPLSLFGMPTTDPPRDTYQTMVATDLPDGYWSFNEDPSERRADVADDVVHDFYQEAVDPPQQKRTNRKARPGPALRRKLGF